MGVHDPDIDPAELAANDAASAPVVPMPGVEVMRPQDVAVVQAANAALQLPAIPGRDEFLSLAMQARVMAQSNIVPKALQGKPHDVFVVLLTGRDLGLSTTAALRKVYVVDGQPSLAPQVTAALVRQKGLGRIVPGESNDDHHAEAIPLGPDGRPMGPASRFTWHDAQVAGLVDERCQPDAHDRRQVTKRGRGGSTYSFTGCECKDNWKAYPARMLWWRAVGYCADDYFPEVSMGLYAPEELDAVTDAEGRPIDPDTVAVPEGFGPAEEPAPRAASAEALIETQVRIAALRPAERDRLKALWAQNERLAGRAAHTLGEGQLRLVIAYLRALEGDAAKDGHDAVDAQRAVWARLEAKHGVKVDAPPEPAQLAGMLRDLAAQSPQEASDAPADPTPAATPEEAPRAAEAADPPDPVDEALEEARVEALDVATVPDEPFAAAWEQERVDAVAERVKGMDLADVDAALVELGKPTVGNEQHRRRLLAQTWLGG